MALRLLDRQANALKGGSGYSILIPGEVIEHKIDEQQINERRYENTPTEQPGRVNTTDRVRSLWYAQYG